MRGCLAPKMAPSTSRLSLPFFALTVMRAGEIAGFFAFRLDDLDAALFGHHRRVDVIDRRFHHRRQETLQHGDGERRDIVLGDVAAVLDLNFLRQRAGHLRVEAAELLAERQIGAQDSQQLRADRRHVDRVAHDALARKSTICSATAMATFSCASSVEAPRCGVVIT